MRIRHLAQREKNNAVYSAQEFARALLSPGAFYDLILAFSLRSFNGMLTYNARLAGSLAISRIVPKSVVSRKRTAISPEETGAIVFTLTREREKKMEINH